MATYVTNYSKIVLRPFHTTPKTVVLRTMPSPYHSHQRWPAASDVRTGTIFGPGQYERQEYGTGTLSPGGSGGTRIYQVLG